MIKYMYLMVTFAAAIGFNYGLFHLFRRNKALFTRMVIFGVGSAMIGRLYETVWLFAFGEIPEGFNIGMLGIIGSLLFFFAANYGQMDSLVDDGSKAFRKSRLIAAAAPVTTAVLFGIFLRYASFGADTIAFLVEAVVIAEASYFHLKHIIMKDVDFGIIRSIRGYNSIALVYATLCMAEMLLKVIPRPESMMAIWMASMCLVLLLIIPVLEKEVAKWTM